MFIREKGLIQFIAVTGLSFALSIGAPSASRAADAAAPAAADAKAPAKDAEPVTTKDPQIALDDLELLLEPMTEEETETEAKGWYSLLRAKEREITVAELDVRRKNNREIAQLEKQKTAAADLAKATEEVKAATSDKDKEAAAQHLADAQKTLSETVKTASKETAKEDKKAEATTAAMAKQADAAPPPAATVNSGTATAGAKVMPAAAGDKDVLQKAANPPQRSLRARATQPRSKRLSRRIEKEAAAADQIKTLAESTPAAAGSAVAASASAPGAASAAVADTSKKAEKLAEKADEASAAKTDVKVQLVDYSTQLMGERTALTDRLKLVLDKFEAKGGDGKPYRMYIASIGGIKIDVTDRTARPRISGWLTSEEGGRRLARDVGTFLAYIIGAIIVARIVRMILRRVISGDHVTSHLLRDFIISSSGRVIIAIGFLLALSALEVNLAPLLAVIGAAGFVVAFALQAHSAAISRVAFSSWCSSPSTSAMKSRSAAASRGGSPM